MRSRTEAHPAFSPEHIYRDSMLGGDIAADAAKAAQACSLARLPGFRLRLLNPRWQNVSCLRGMMRTGAGWGIHWLLRAWHAAAAGAACCHATCAAAPRALLSLPPHAPSAATPRIHPHPRFTTPCPPCTHKPQAGCRLLDSLAWNLFILAITLFAVFAPDVAIITSGAYSAASRRWWKPPRLVGSFTNCTGAVAPPTAIT